MNAKGSSVSSDAGYDSPLRKCRRLSTEARLIDKRRERMALLKIARTDG
ncbi:MAG: hypothetical protein O3B74_11290 [Proteobacteria bacterium]|nr:hypothetical protein [Pseudomonadota bacterium]